MWAGLAFCVVYTLHYVAETPRGFAPHGLQLLSNLRLGRAHGLSSTVRETEKSVNS